jgi:hypothetical protein
MDRARPSAGGRVNRCDQIIVVIKKPGDLGWQRIADCGRSHRAIGVPPENLWTGPRCVELRIQVECETPANQRAMIETWLEGDLSKWRLENLRGKTGRNKTGLTGNMGPPRLVILD